VAGLGFALGPIAVGANAKYVLSSTYNQACDFEEWVDGPPSIDWFKEVFSHKIDESMGETESNLIEVGLGAVFTLGTLNAGIYNDNIMPFLSEGYSGDYIGEFMNAMNFGVSWMPSDNKFGESKFPFILLASVDLKNFGDARTASSARLPSSASTSASSTWPW
jgi:hypothetical protein